MDASPTDVDEVDVSSVAGMDAPITFATTDSRAGVWLRRGLLSLLGLGVLVASTSYIVRHESVCGSFLDARLDHLKTNAGVRIVRSDIRPIGFMGMEVRDVIVRRPDEGGSLWLAVERMEVYPDLLSVLSMEPRVGKIVLDGVEMNLVTGGEKSDFELFREIRASLSGARGAGSTSSPSAASPAAVPTETGLWKLPLVEFIGAHVRFEDLDGRYPKVVFDSERLTLDKVRRGAQLAAVIKGDVDIVGYGKGELDGEFAVPSFQGRVGVLWETPRELADLVQRHVKEPMLAESKIIARGVSLHWPAGIGLKDVTIENLDLTVPWATRDGARIARPRIRGAKAAALTISRKPDRITVNGSGAALVADLPGASGHSVPLGNAFLDLDKRRSKILVSLDFFEEVGAGSVNLRWDLSEDHLELTAKIEGVPLTPYLPFIPESVGRYADLRGGVLGGTLVLDLRPSQGFADLKSDLNMDRGALLAPVVSPNLLEDVSMGVKGHIIADVEEGLFSLEGGHLRLGELGLATEGRLQVAPDGQWDISVDAKAVATDAHKALTRLPKGLAPALDGYKLSGLFDGSMKLEVDSRDPSKLTLNVAVNSEMVEVVKSGGRAPIQSLTGDFELEPVALPSGIVIGPSRDDWVSLADLPKVVPQAITMAEDGKFFRHNGFDISGIRVALRRNIERGALARGGSTISQQVIKNLFLNHERTVSRKLQEVFLTWHMEQSLSKERILEIYLNMLHLGPDIYGLREASWVLFRKRAERLSLREAVFLGSILPNPDRFVRLYADRKIPPDRRIKMRNILNSMMLSGYIGEPARDKASGLTDMGVISISTPPTFEKL